MFRWRTEVSEAFRALDASQQNQCAIALLSDSVRVHIEQSAEPSEELLKAVAAAMPALDEPASDVEALLNDLGQALPHDASDLCDGVVTAICLALESIGPDGMMPVQRCEHLCEKLYSALVTSDINDYIESTGEVFIGEAGTNFDQHSSKATDEINRQLQFIEQARSGPGNRFAD